MDMPTDTNQPKQKKLLIRVMLLLIAAIIFGWAIGRYQNSRKTPTDNQTVNQSASNTSDSANIKSIVKYHLPDGWKESSCQSAPGAIFVIPSGAGEVDCSSSPSSPIKMSIDPANNTDCNQLQNVQNVSKHICISEYINGKKSLRAETHYNSQSAYRKDITILAYYINTGKGVAKIEYSYTSHNAYQVGWEELAKSVSVK